VSTNRSRGRLLALPAAIAALLLVAAPVFAHAELVSSDPADGAKLATPPTAITLMFSEGVNASRSSFDLISNGTTIGTGKADAPGDTTMVLRDLTLDPGDYTIRWTSVATDGDLLRGTLTFTVLAAGPGSPSPTATVGPICTDECGTPTTGATPTVAPVTAAPRASADTTPVSSSATDVLLPIVIGLLAVAGVGAFLVSRSRRA
jgi:methionine-rich copper-binding protein CopC